MVLTLDDLLLRKEELPILRETIFPPPVHPLLMRDDIRLDPNLAVAVYEQVVKDWCADLLAYVNLQAGGRNCDWYRRAFLDQDLTVQFDFGRFQIPALGWECTVSTDGRGFAEGLAVARGGSAALCPPEQSYIGPPNILFSAEKFEAYRHPDASRRGDELGVSAYVYGYHNVDALPQALFLRNWAILYHNAALQSVADWLR